MAELAKLDFRCEINVDCLDLTWSGFNDAMPSYVDEVITRLLAMRDADLELEFG